jgi:hypothetical protein
MDVSNRVENMERAGNHEDAKVVVDDIRDAIIDCQVSGNARIWSVISFVG